MADFASLVTLDSEGNPSSRFVTIRSLASEEIALIINDRSPKAVHLRVNGRYELLIFWPNLMIQYRIRGSFRIERTKDLEKEWRKKGKPSQLMDIFHSRVKQQSLPLESHAYLLNGLTTLGQQLGIDRLPIPDSVKYLVLLPKFIEQWIGSPSDRLHKRTLFHLKEDGWHSQLLIP
jgi:pyridoxamine 5'-phosphate oxidase